LEVGAGFGGTTYSILSELCNPQTSEPLFSDYTFTDISPGFFERAQETLHPWSSYVKYKVLDIEDHPQSQGFQACHYGMIIAANVLHATKSIAETLTHLHYLLRPGGRLCLIDYTNPGLGVNIIYGCLPGWWK
jgi:SAM-dependent methyltransferase